MSVKKKKNNDNKNFLIFVFLLMVVFVAIFNKGTKSTDVIEENTDYLTLTCPDSALSNEEVLCNINLNSTSIITQGITIKYSFPEGVSFVEFNSDNFEIYSNDESGIVLINLDGVSGENLLVGNLKLKMPTDALGNSVYKIELVESTIGDGNETVVNLENASDEIRIKSDINTLDSITLSSGELNETFDKDTLEYTVTTDIDKITISAIATDKDRATISGDVDIEKALHYGNNEFNIVVTSESGIDKIYKVSVFKTYKFTSDKYLYNEEDNYIYVGTDINNLLNNIIIDDGLSKDIEDNRLIISYMGEKLLEINILSISFDKYILSDDTLYVDKELTTSEFTENVSYSEGITFEIVDDTVKVLYDNYELDSYKLVVYSLNFDSSMTIDEEKSYIKYLEIGMTVDEFLDMITVIGGEAHLYNKNGIEKTVDNIIASGDILKVYLGNTLMDEYLLSVLGDCNGDGRMSSMDLAQFRKHLVDWKNPDTGLEFELSGVYVEAMDLYKDERISAGDLAVLRRIIVR